jgi:DNA-3-methyladenine glycosylase II
LTTVATEHGGMVLRLVGQIDTQSGRLLLRTNRPDLDHQRWADAVLGVDRCAPPLADPVIREIATRYPGMRPYSNGDLFEGIVTAIVGQSISVQAAAVTERKLAALFAKPVAHGHRQYWPSPTAEQLANATPELVRASGVTQRRANAIVAIARLAVDNQLLEPDTVHGDEQAIYQSVLRLPQVGRWTAQSVLLWGLGVDDAYPNGDVALLRAARRAYARPELVHAEMDVLSEGWRPGRSWAARWLWLNLFGPAPTSSPCG